MTASRRRPAVQRSRSSLSQRDQRLLTDVGKVRLLTARQIERLHFTEGTELSRARRARRCLKRLHEQALLDRFERRVGGIHSGSAGFIYCLSSLGQRVLGTGGPAGGSRRRRPWEPSVHFQDHMLETAEIYVQLCEIEASEHETELVSYQGEPYCWRTFLGSAGATFTLKPDAYVHLAVADFEQVTFVELDRSTEHMPTIRRKLAVYIDAYEAGAETQNGDPFPNVLWIAPATKRVRELRREIQRLEPPHQALFEVTTKEQQIPCLKGGNQ